MTQMDLAFAAEVSTRHLSFVETGRSQPSRELLLVLGSVLDLPLRDRNAVLVAGGFAPAYRETDLSAPEMGPVRQAIDFILRSTEPHGAVLVDGRWNLLQANRPASLFTQRFVVNPEEACGGQPPNLLRLLLHPAGIRDHCSNWTEVAQAMISRVHREVSMGEDRDLAKLVDEVLSYPGVPKNFRAVDVQQAPPLLIPMNMHADGVELRLFTTITTVGTALDVTLQELRIESFFPADAATAAVISEMWSGMQ